MTDIAAATASLDLEQRLLAATGGVATLLPQGPLPSDLGQLVAQLGQPLPPQVVVLDCALGSEDALLLAGRLAEEPLAPKVVLVSDQAAELGLAALRSGVFDIVHPGTDPDTIGQVLRQARAAGSNRVAPADRLAANPSPGGRVISVVSPKGGAGKTTVATNIAVGLAQQSPHSTVLVDLDVQFGDVASALNLDPEYSLTDAVSGAASRDSMVLKTFLTLHETGLYVLAAPESPAAADGIRGADIERLLAMLTSEFAFVVVDTAPGLSEHTLAAMDQTTDPVLLTSMDVPGVRGLRKEIDALDELDMLTKSRRLVLNFADPRSGLSVADVEATVGTRVEVSLPRSKSVPTSVNLGVPLLQSGGNDPMTKQLRKLVRGLQPGHEADAKSRSVKTSRSQRTKAPRPRRAAHRWLRPVGIAS
jgi:pilus assembly protein CpaE